MAPGAQLDPAARYYVVFKTSDEQALHQIIARDLQARGLAVESGFDDKVPADTDVLVRYGGQWQWDVTWYLLDVQIQFYAVDGEQLLASAQSYRTSLVRKSPADMVRVALDGVFGVGGG